ELDVVSYFHQMLLLRQPFRNFGVKIGAPVALGEAAQHDAEKAGQALVQPIDEPEHDLRFSLAQFLKKLAETRKGQEVVGFRLRAALNDREPFFRVPLVDLRYELADALLPVGGLLFQI